MSVLGFDQEDLESGEQGGPLALSSSVQSRNLQPLSGCRVTQCSPEELDKGDWLSLKIFEFNG